MTSSSVGSTTVRSRERTPARARSAGSKACCSHVEAVFRQAMADPATRDAVPSIERVRIPAGEAIRVELSSRPEPDTPYDVAQVQYYLPTMVGFFAIWFSAAANDLAAYRTTFDAMARTFLHADLYPEDYLDRFLLAVTK
jgi:hypothetical protein